MKTIEEDIHSFCDRLGKKKTSHKRTWYIASSVLVLFILIASMGIPLFNGLSGYDILMGSNSDTDLIVYGDEPVDDVEPFVYWYAPDNSFGVSSAMFVNWSFFDTCFSYEKYFDGEESDYELEIEFEETSNSNIRKYKYKLKTEDAGFYGLTIIFDYKNDDYVFDVENYTFIVNYDGGDIFYNFTDIVNTLDGDIDYYIQDNIFYLVLGKYLEEDVEFEIDPNFGNEDDTEYGRDTIAIRAPIDYFTLVGCNFTVDEAFTPTSITALLSGQDGIDCDVKLCIYDPSDWSLLYTTESKYVDHGESNQWWTFNISGASELPAGKYMLGAIGDAADMATTYDAMRIVYSHTHPESAFEQFVGSFTLPNTGVADNFDPLHNYSIYCTYTESAVANSVPTSGSEAPTNSTTQSWAGNVRTYAVVTDDDSDTMNCSWWSNSSGTWKQYGVGNTTVSTGTNISQENANFSTAGNKYWWWIIINDGEGGEANDSYSFTINANISASVFTILGLCGTLNNITWTGDPNTVVWSNSTSGCGGTLEYNMTINITNNITLILVYCDDIDASITADNIELFLSSDNSSFGSVGSFSSGGSNLTIDKNMWDDNIMGTNIFNESGLTDRTVSIFLRFRLTIPVGVSAGTYTQDDWKIRACEY